MLQQFPNYQIPDNLPSSHIAMAFMVQIFEKFKTIANIEDYKITEESLTLGVDPEFLAYEKAGKSGLADYRSYVNPRDIVQRGDGEIGTDCGTLGEFRPKPSASPYILTHNIKKLVTQLNTQMKREYGRDLFIETGGGCVDNIGGHIHFGHPIFQNVGEDDIYPLTLILDDFLYFPIKTNMYGGIRLWSEMEEIESELEEYDEINSPTKPTKEIIKIIKKAKIAETEGFSDYENNEDDKYREQEWGIEYRSLPSFIGDFTFTNLVLKLAKGITLEYLKSLQSGGEIEYEKPPEKKDYAKYLTENEVNKLWEYLYGKKRDLFLKDMIKNWEVELDVFFKIKINNIFENVLFQKIPYWENMFRKIFREQMKKGRKESISFYFKEGYGDLQNRCGFIIGDKVFLTWINSATQQIISSPSYEKEIIEDFQKKYDIVALVPPSVHNTLQHRTKIYRDLIFDLTKSYFDGKNRLEKWTKFFILTNIAYNKHNKLKKKKRRIREEENQRAWRAINTDGNTSYHWGASGVGNTARTFTSIPESPPEAPVPTPAQEEMAVRQTLRARRREAEFEGLNFLNTENLLEDDSE